MNEANYSELIECYGFLFEPELLEEIRRKGTCHSAKANMVILDYGDEISAMPLVIDGAIKILRQDSNQGKKKLGVLLASRVHENRLFAPWGMLLAPGTMLARNLTMSSTLDRRKRRHLFQEGLS